MEKIMRSVRAAAAACALLVTLAASASAQQTIFVVRHAERADAAPSPGTAAMTSAPADPPLSAAGRERAARLAVMLRSAGIRRIFSTEFLRTRQTAAPAAEALRLEVVQVPSKDLEGLLAQVRLAKGNALIVGHSNTVPGLLKRLGIKDDIAIADDEYDNLFVVVRPESGEPTLVRLRY
jgi:phosphohistidine phosphatase SixA